MDLTDTEWKIARDQFRKCDGLVVRPDITFVSPSVDLKRHPAEISDRLQKAHDFLLAATPVTLPPKHFFGGQSGRIVVGYRHSSDESSGKPCEASWYGPENRVNIPWARLTIPESHPLGVRIEDQPEFTASHELVHPFEHIFLWGGNPNGKWNDAFCDCLRVMVLEEMGFSAYATEWEKFIKNAAATQTGDRYHDAAGRVFNWIESHAGGRKNMTTANVEKAISQLIGQDMFKLLDPKGRIKF